MATNIEVRNIIVGWGGVSLGFADSEVPIWVIDGVNTSFTLANIPITGSTKIYLNWLRETEYTIIADTITFTSPPMSWDTILTDYRY